MTSWIIGLLCLFSLGNQYSHITAISTSAEHFSSDRLGNCYLLEGEVLTRYDLNGQDKISFNEVKYGKLASVDASNPLKLVLYYPDFLNVVFLDNSLTRIGQVSLYNSGYDRVQAVAASNDFNLWLFDEIENKLLKLDDKGKVIRESEDMRLILGRTIQPVFIVAESGLVYVNVPDLGILVFDEYAAYAKTISIKGLADFQVKNGNIIYHEGNSLRTYNSKTLEVSNIVLPDSVEFLDIEVQKDRLFLLGKGKLDIYGYDR